MHWAWAGWLAAIAGSFALFEGFALAYGRMTLSRFIWLVSKAWPPFPFICGLGVGGLAVHFWWHWCPT